jgi:hypothetical protein
MAGVQCGRGVLVLTVLLGICSLALGESPEVSPPGPEKSASGYIKVNETEDAHLFYWLFYPREPEHSLGTIIWLSGGPGSARTSSAPPLIPPYLSSSCMVFFL